MHGQRRNQRSNRRFLPAEPAPLEPRALLASVTVDAGQVVRAVISPQLLGVNATWWDSSLNSSQTQQMVEAAGLNLFRLPGGSSSDSFHFNEPPSYNGQGTIPSMASFVASVNGQAVVTLDYGSGSPQEAAAMLAYLNAPVGATTTIGDGPEWNTTTGSWQTVDWKTAGYWASLRAASPLPVDDGLNFMRLGRTAPFGFQYFEVGNEVYGSWETDFHTAPHDPATYVAFAKAFQIYAATIDPTISIGVDAAAPDNEYNNWIANVLQLSAAQGFSVGFISDHNYVQAPGSESDSTLLLDTVSDPSSPFDWAVRAQGYTSLLNQYLGAAGAKVELLTTEFNSVYSNPGKQTTSLVNGLFVADSLGQLMETSYSGAVVWDLRNGWDTTNNNSSSLYGWRQGGDYGLIGSPGPSPQTGSYVPYPTYFAEQLASKIVQAGGSVVQASSSDPDLAVYAVHEPGGDLDLLVINKSAAGAITGQFQLTGYQPASQAQIWQYGEAQDTAQSHSSAGQSALAVFTATLNVSGSSFSYDLPAYSMTVIDVSKAAAGGGGPTSGGPTFTSAAAATPNPVAGTTTALSAFATDPSGGTSLVYTWSTLAGSPGGVVFGRNGSAASRTTTATFHLAGTYGFRVTVVDPSGLSASSDVSVTVDATLTSITVHPGTASVEAGGTAAFTAQAIDQFGNAISPLPVFIWSVASGSGLVNRQTGAYSAPSTTGSAVVEASSAGVFGTAIVTVTAMPAQPPGGQSAIVSYTDSADWGSGFVGDVLITNTGPAAIGSWILRFDFAPRITAIWGATLVKRSGEHYEISSAIYNGTIPPDASVSFGFQGKRGHGRPGPTDITLNGVPMPSPQFPAVSATAAYTLTSQSRHGFGASITVTNTGTATIGGWTLQFEFAPRITSIRGAAVARRAGSRYVIRDAGYNGLIAPGQSVSFQLKGTRRKLVSSPVNYVLDGVPIA